MLEVLCPRWGRCKAKKKCPLKAASREKVYVLGPCANKEATKEKTLKGFREEWEKVIKKLKF